MSTGFIAESFYNVFYNRIWISTSEIDFTGQNPGDTETISVWNSYNTAKHMTAVTGSNISGINISSSSAHTFQPYEVDDFTLTLTSSAASTILGNFQFLFSDAEDPLVSIIGTVTLVFSYPIDWSSGVEEHIEFNTKIISSKDGEEQTIRMRTFPRIKYVHNTLFAENSSLADAARLQAYFHNHILRNMGRTWALPIWSDSYVLGTTMALAASSVSVDTTTRDFYVGQKVIMLNKWDDYQIFTIQSLTTSSLTFTTTATKAWLAGQAFLLPLRNAVLTDDSTSANLQTYWLSNNTMTWSLTVENINQSTKYKSYSPSYNYAGYDVYIKDHNFDEDAGVTINNYQRLFDYGYGIFKVNPAYSILQKPYNKEGYTFNYILRDRNDYIDFLAFLKYRSGRAYPCWIPTFGNEIQIAQSGTLVDTQIIIKDIGYSYYVGSGTSRLDQSRKNILLLDTNNNYRFYTITGYQNNMNGTETLFLDRAVGINFTPSTFTNGCFLKFMRLVNDEVVINWETDSWAKTSLSFIETVYKG